LQFKKSFFDNIITGKLNPRLTNAYTGSTAVQVCMQLKYSPWINTDASREVQTNMYFANME